MPTPFVTQSDNWENVIGDLQCPKWISTGYICNLNQATPHIIQYSILRWSVAENPLPPIPGWNEKIKCLDIYVTVISLSISIFSSPPTTIPVIQQGMQHPSVVQTPLILTDIHASIVHFPLVLVPACSWAADDKLCGTRLDMEMIRCWTIHLSIHPSTFL